ncbi:alpha/beta hydrolase [Halomicronema sp. CCY15110]|uniref:alpha/beta hydrolase n=1 Tax=Halomicronema sp. CCY15110 TaxID=2767773 RepID=UPI0019519FF9|nr:alpha/beta hydrolase [Halomicronema sp. CCY15110]
MKITVPGLPLRLYVAPAMLRILSATVMGIAIATPSFGAEQVKFRVGFFSRTLPVASLVTFAEDGTVDEHLSPFLGNLDDETLTTLQMALVTSRSEDPIAFSQKLYSPMGTRLLQSTGLTIRTGSGRNGQIALRSALSQAMHEPGGGSLIDVLRLFPTESVTVDLLRVLAIRRQLQRAIAETDTFMEAVATQSALTAENHPIDYADLPDLRDRGPYPVRFIPLDLVDDARNRPVPADLFLPEVPNADAGTVPIIVFSHGLGHSRVYFRDVAEHVASYGFAVAMPEHVGSNETQKHELEAWLADEFFQRREFIDRPQDVSFLLDELSRLNDSQWNRQLNTQSVGAIGHSFGGYTVLANAGATVDFAWLQEQCNPDAVFVSNISKLLQCRALELANSPQDVAMLSQGGLKDERIKLVMAFNTVSNLFGQSGAAQIQVPTLIAGGVYDYVTPVIPEQADTFKWLTTPDKYFLLVDQKAHSAESTRALMQFVYPIEANLDLELAEAWLRSNYRALIVAFAQTHLANRDEYRPYLEASYVNYISQPPFSMHLIRDWPEPLTSENN